MNRTTALNESRDNSTGSAIVLQSSDLLAADVAATRLPWSDGPHRFCSSNSSLCAQTEV